MGDGLGESSYLPVQVASTTGFTNHTSISAGFGDTACGLASDGAAFCWGSGGSGQLGNGANDLSNLPVAVSTLSAGVKDIYVGDSHVCAVNSANGAVCWGNNYWGTLGNASNTNSNVPVAVSGLSSGVTQVAAGNLHSCAVVGGAVKCWGYGGDGALGNGSNGNSNVPVQVSGITTGATAVTAGSYHSCALVNGGVKCWGFNIEGQLGNNTTLNSNVPVQVVGLTSRCNRYNCRRRSHLRLVEYQ